MRITMLTLGSRGDVQPLLALSGGLQRHGHQVRLATYPRFEPMVTGAGIEFAPLAEGALSQGRDTDEGRRWVEKGHRRQPTWVGFVRDARSVAHRRLADAARACAEADVIVATNLAQLLGWQMADELELPLVRILFHAPTYWMATQSASPGRRIVRQLAWLAARPWLNSVRRASLSLPTLPWREPIGELEHRSQPVIYPVSPAVFPVPSGSRPSVAIAGYWFPDAALDPAPPAALQEFLVAGPPPVYVGFGTQIDPDAERTTQMLVNALRSAGCRGILLRSSEALGGVPLGDDIFALTAISHQWLFERCAAVVHHAAAGTTAAGLRAGVPAVAVPHNTDQFSWARRLHELGVAPAPVRRRHLSATKLGAAISEATNDHGIRGRAAALGERIRAEDGVEVAVRFFEQAVTPTGRRARAARIYASPSAVGRAQ
jgi:sterol 3beta-glucosyltransferase